MITEHWLIVTNCNDAQMVQLKQLGVIPLTSARVNLLQREIASSLCVRFKNVKRRYEELAQLGEISGAGITVPNESNGLSSSTAYASPCRRRNRH